MPLLNRVFINQDDFRQIKNYYRNGKNHNLRQKAHLLILRSKGFSLSKLMIILSRDRQYIKLIIKGWYYLGYDCFKNLSRQALKNQIQEARRKKFLFWRSLFNIKNIIKKLLNLFGIFILWIWGGLLSLLKGIWTIITVPIIWIWSTILKIALKILSLVRAIDFKYYYYSNKQKITNRLEIGKQSSHNIVIQIVNNFQEGIHYSKDNVEKIVTSTFSETKQQMYNILESGKELVSSDLVVAIALKFNEKIQHIKSVEKRKRLVYILATIMACYIVFNASLKSGLVLITILGITITLNVGECSKDFYLKQKNYLKNYFQTKNDTTSIDSVLMTESDEPLLPKYLSDNDCYYLSILDKKFIEQDTTNYYNKKFFVNYPDNHFYLHVAAYRDIREAAFQRNFLIQTGFPNSKILQKYNWQSHLYLVTIADFLPEQVYKLCKLKEDWDVFCNNNKCKAQVVFNNY